MSISSSATRKAGPFSGNGVTTAFSFTFKVFATSDVLVVQTDPNGIQTTLALTTNYTVALNADQDNNPGGTVTLNTAPATGYTVTLGSQVLSTQPVVLTNTGGFYPTVLNDEFDRLTILSQQISEILSRSFTIPFSSPTTVSTQAPAPTANQIIGWNDAGNALKNFDPSAFAALVAYGSAVADVFTGDGATVAFTLSQSPTSQANLDVSVAGSTKVPGVDYSWAGGTTLTFTTAPANGAKILARYFNGLIQSTVSDGSITQSKLASITGTGSVVLQNAPTLVSPIFSGSVNGGPLAGFRNAIINGSFRINQRAVSGTVTLSAGAYGHDRWKAGASGCTYTFAASGEHTVITISAGSLMQVIEGASVGTLTYALSHQGTAQARIAVNGGTTSGAYTSASTATPLTASATGGQNVTIEFSTGTVDRVQFEPGVVGSIFEQRPIGQELILCQRYYQRIGNGSFAYIFQGYQAASQQIGETVAFCTEMRAIPTATILGTWTVSNCGQPSIGALTTKYFQIRVTATALGSVGFNTVNQSTYVDLNAEL